MLGLMIVSVEVKRMVEEEVDEISSVSFCCREYVKNSFLKKYCRLML